MAKIPKKPEEIFGEITDDFQKAFGDDLVSIILYGSAAGSDYVPGTSDINFLITLTENGIHDLGRAMDLVKRWRKQNVATPLFMTREYLLSSVDSYPVEFLNMKQNHVAVFGNDVLSELTFDQCDLRLQIEREMKGKLLLLRSGFLETEGKSGKVRDLIRVSLTAFIAAFKALLYLKDMPPPHARRDVIREAAKVFSIDGDVFLKCNDVKENRDRLSASEIEALFNAYLKEIHKLCIFVDHMDI